MDYDEFNAHTAARRVDEWRTEGLNEILDAIADACDKGETLLIWSNERFNSLDSVIMALRKKNFTVKEKVQEKQLFISWNNA